MTQTTARFFSAPYTVLPLALLVCGCTALSAEKTTAKGGPEASWTRAQWKDYVDGWSAATHRHTPLNEAAYKGDIEKVRLLLKHGADLKLRAHITDGDFTLAFWDDSGYRQNIQTGASGVPLVAAIVGGHADVVEYLLDKGADPNLGDRRVTPLHFAVSLDRLDMVEQLLVHKADVNRSAPGLGTPLHLAVREVHPEIAKRLVYAGADLQADFEPYPFKDAPDAAPPTSRYTFHTPADFALQQGNMGLPKTLEQAARERDKHKQRK